MRLTSLLLLLISIGGWSQLPDSRRVDWSNTGNTNNLTVDREYKLLDLQSYLSESDLDNAVAMAITDNPDDALILQIPEGQFTANSTIILRSNVVLRGMGSDKTTIKLKLDGSGHGIEASGTDLIIKYPMTAWDSLGGYNIHVTNSPVKPGDWIRISEDNDGRIHSKWANGWIGQIAKVESVNGSEITLNTPLTLNYQNGNNPKINLLNPVVGVGVEDLSLVRYDETFDQTSNIYFRYVMESWITGVASKYTNFGHVTLSRSANNLVTGCYFHDAFNFGGGGKAYGVVMQFAASANKITNNAFNKLRHSILLQACANGNVIGYNYSQEPYWTGVMAPSGTAGDLVLHGNYVFTNLFEGNVVSNLVIDDSHGINGRLNTFFRNRVEHLGIFMNPATPSPGQNFIGNEITGKGKETYMFVDFELGMYSLQGGDHYEAGNTNGEKLWGELPDSLPPSLYLTDVPTFWNQSNFPCIGGKAPFNTHHIPAQNRTQSNYPAVNGGEIRARSLFSFGTTTASLNANRVSMEVVLIGAHKEGRLRLQTWKQTYCKTIDSVLLNQNVAEDTTSYLMRDEFEGYVPIYRWEYQIGQFKAHSPLFTLRQQDGKTVVSEPSKKELSVLNGEKTHRIFHTFTVVSSTGRILRTGNYAPGSTTLEVDGLPAGVYWVIRKSNDGYSDAVRKMTRPY